MIKIRIVAVTALTVAALAGCAQHGHIEPHKPVPTSTPAPSHSISPTSPAPTVSPTTRPTSPAPTTPPVTDNPPASAPPVTLEQRNATRSAQDYLADQSFSRSGLINQLKYDKYSTKAATAAVDSLHANWNAEAAESAKQYLSDMGFSRQGLIDQLKYDGYTTAQATYGTTKAGL